jgi:hypothetical protein
MLYKNIKRKKLSIQEQKQRKIKILFLISTAIIVISLGVFIWCYLKFMWPVFTDDNTSIVKGTCVSINSQQVILKGNRKRTRYIFALDDGSTYFILSGALEAANINIDVLEEKCVGQELELRYSNSVVSFGANKIAEIITPKENIYSIEVANNEQKNNQYVTFVVISFLFVVWILFAIMFTSNPVMRLKKESRKNFI